ncbi:hypothetical protein HHI36_000516 [Cryptolaemus montrouzieri]|uniref:RanBP2-type domain-containing protein n=1 Tax=Cryptolaemus montrouzieri TaxID=559131 RepID=A0ABD2P5K7_9CUCU
MVIMDNYYLQDRLTELWRRIDKLHLKYLDIEESPEKLDIRIKLEDSIREYLCMASHHQKFSLPVTYEVLYRSANEKPDFSGYKAATGFNALQLYSGNLFSQPWRKEYRQIRKYSGFYKHHVESNLVKSELVLEAMGYKPIGLSTLILDGPIGPDKVISVSKDCLIAYVECQIVKAIWEEMANSNMNISWLEILDFRQTHLCSLEHSIKGLKYQYQQRHFQEHIRSNSQGNLNTHHVISGYSNHSFPPLSTHDHLQPALHPQYMCSVNGCCQNACMTTYAEAQMQGTPLFPPAMPYAMHNMIKPQFNANGYYYANGLNAHAPNYNPNVPIAQLIEVEPQNGYDIVDRPCHSRSTQQMAEMYANYNGEDFISTDKREGELEDWDYVYKTLENKGYNKDLGERGDVLSLGIDGKSRQDPKITDKKRKEKEGKKSRASTLEVSMNNLTVSNKSKQSDKISKQRKLSDTKSQTEVSPATSYDNLTPNEKKQLNKTSTLSSTKSKAPTPSKNNLAKQDSKNLKKEEKAKTKDKPEFPPWHCKTCTYLNHTSKNICEMCSKTRSNIEEEIEVGGAECEKCTLVNPKDAKICQACSESLENSPTRV